jgi:hypothetical protein
VRYREVLDQDMPWLNDVVRTKRPARLPVVLTRDEVLNRGPAGVRSPADRMDL